MKQDLPPPTGAWTAATGFARGEDPADTAMDAARAAQARLAGAPAGAVVFFECFDRVPSADRVIAAIALVFPDAQIIGCSTVGIATANGAAGDGAVAVLVIGGTGCGFAAAYAPGKTPSAEAAAASLLRQFGPLEGPTATVLLAAPTPAWDPGELVSRLAGDQDEPTAIFGGLAAPRGPDAAVRIYCNDRGYSDGAAALRIVGPMDWACDTRHELLRVGPVWRARQVQDYSIGQLASDGQTLPADKAVARFLIAQERADGHIARLVGGRDVPLRFTPGAGGAIVLPTRVAADERLVLLKSGPAEARIRAVREGLARVRLPAGVCDGPPVTLLALPAESAGLPAGAAGAAGDTDEQSPLARIREELAQPALAHPAPIAFFTPGQFAPILDPAGNKTFAFHQHTTATLQLGRRFGPLHRPTTAAD